MGDRNGETFGYAEFGSWYDAYRAETLEPALDRAMDALQRELDDALSERDLARIRSISGRVKSKRRTWRKVNQRRYRQAIPTVDDIPAVIDDLVGMRLTCTNLRDIEMVQVALENLPQRERQTNAARPRPDLRTRLRREPQAVGLPGVARQPCRPPRGRAGHVRAPGPHPAAGQLGRAHPRGHLQQGGRVAAARRSAQYEDGRPARHPGRHRRGPPQRTRPDRRGDRRRDRRPGRRTCGRRTRGRPRRRRRRPPP